MLKLFVRFLFWSLLIVGSRLAFAETVSPYTFNEFNPDFFTEEGYYRQDFRIIKPSYRGTRNLHQAQIESILFNKKGMEEQGFFRSKIRNDEVIKVPLKSRIRGKDMTVIRIRGTKMSIDQLY